MIALFSTSIIALNVEIQCCQLDSTVSALGRVMGMCLFVHTCTYIETTVYTCPAFLIFIITGKPVLSSYNSIYCQDYRQGSQIPIDATSGSLV